MKSVQFAFKGLLFLLIVVLAAGCGLLPGNIVTGSGVSKTETRNVSGFSSLLISGAGTVTISVTGTESLTIEADDNLLPYFTSDVKNGQLELGTKPNTSISPRVGPNYILTVKSLDNITLSGSADSAITGLNANNLNVEISGSGAVTAGGRADNLAVTISGSGNFTGDNLIAKTGSVVLSGSGEVLINASDTLNVDLSGSGNVQYIGDPHLNTQISGSGEVRKH